MNLPFDNVIHILEYVGDYENLLFLDKKTTSIFQNIDLHKLYINDMKKYLLIVDDYIDKCSMKVNMINKRLKLYHEPYTYQSCHYIETLIRMNKNDKSILENSIVKLENEKKILGNKVC
jgi:hypothetical protein